MKRKAKVGDFVFWKYQSAFKPPTYLGGIVTHVNPSGRVRVEGYSTMSFEPVHVTDPKTGEKLFALLQAAEQQRDAAVRAADRRFEIARDGLLQGREPGPQQSVVVVLGTLEYEGDSFLGAYESLEQAKRAVTRTYADYVTAYRTTVGQSTAPHDTKEAIAWAWGSSEYDLDWQDGGKP